MRRFLLLAAAATLVACSPPSSTDAPTSEAPSTETPAPLACNDVAPNTAQAVTLQGDVAVAAAVADLRGGRVTPGLYDLASGNRIGAATGWQGARAVSLQVIEEETGTIFNYASAAPSGAETERWTAGFIDSPTPHLTYTCGKSGGADVAFTAEANGLQIRIPEESGAGSLYLVFVRRA